MSAALNVTADPPPDESLADILSSDALAFVGELHRRFEPRRQELLAARRDRDAELRAGGALDFLPETREVREGDWRVPEPPADLRDRRVEITGPTDRKLTINALNSGAQTFMADFEDANSPTWRNVVEGQRNMIDAIERTITYDSAEDDRHYELADETATIIVRPRGWHLDERHVQVDGAPVAGAFVDFGLFFFHSARRLVDRGSGPYFYLPKLEHHGEAALWNDVFVFAQEALGLPQGTVRATVLIETLPAAFQMEEILHALRDHSAGLNAGRWDYIFSAIKCFRDRPEFVTPDRTDVKMTVPFMRAYTELLVRTCHRRGAHAMGGMAALIPSRKDPEANEKAIEGVREDKRREASDGFDGTWVAHPDIVEPAREEFDQVLGDRPNQIDRQREDVRVAAADLLDVAATPGAITETGLRNDVGVGFQYISFWLGGRGAAAINNLMEDAATAEISRAQLWQWIRHGAKLDDGRTITRELVSQVLDEEMARIREEVGEETWRAGRPEDTREIFERVALSEDFPEFLTLVAYEKLEAQPSTPRVRAG
jgi:malate synthase